MARRLALGALTLSSILILVSCLLGGGAAELGFALLAVGFPVILMVVGATDRQGSLGSVVWPIGVLFLSLEACLIAMLALRGEVDSGAWLLGLPAAAAVQLFGIFLAPLALVALGYALTFGSFDVNDDDLERLRQLSGRREDE